MIRTPSNRFGQPGSHPRRLLSPAGGLLSLLWVLLIGAAAPLTAQTPDSVEAGTLVRAHTSVFTTQGRVISMSRDGIALEPETGDPILLDWSDVSRLEVAGETKSSTARGAVIGLGVGVMVSAVLAASVKNSDSGEAEGIGLGAAFALTLPVTALPLGLLGGLMGSRTMRQTWQSVPVPQAGPLPPSAEAVPFTRGDRAGAGIRRGQ